MKILSKLLKKKKLTPALEKSKVMVFKKSGERNKKMNSNGKGKRDEWNSKENRKEAHIREFVKKATNNMGNKREKFRSKL